MGWLKKTFDKVLPENKTTRMALMAATGGAVAGAVGGGFAIPYGAYGAAGMSGKMKMGPDGTPVVDKGPVSALMTAEENTAEAMKRLFRMGVYVAPMFGGEQAALASTKLFGN